MSKLTKIGIIFLVSITLFFVIGIVSVSNMTPDERESYDDKRAAEKEIKLQKEIDTLKEKLDSKELIESQQEIKKDTISNSEMLEIMKNFDDVQSFPITLLETCRNVDSYQDYLTFVLAVGVLKKQGQDLVELAVTTDIVLSMLELTYDHPQINREIIHTRNLYLEAGTCMEQMVVKYRQ